MRGEEGGLGVILGRRGLVLGVGLFEVGGQGLGGGVLVGGGVGGVERGGVEGGVLDGEARRGGGGGRCGCFGAGWVVGVGCGVLWRVRYIAEGMGFCGLLGGVTSMLAEAQGLRHECGRGRKRESAYITVHYAAFPEYGWLVVVIDGIARPEDFVLVDGVSTLFFMLANQEIFSRKSRSKGSTLPRAPAPRHGC